MRGTALSFIVLGLLALSASATPAIIDHFSDGTFDHSSKLGPIIDSQTTLAQVIGANGLPPGQRDVLVTISGPGTQNTEVTAIASEVSLSTPPSTNAILEFSYGSYTTFGDLGAVWSGYNGLMFELEYADLNGQVIIDLKCKSNASPFTSLVIPIPPVALGAGPVVFTVPFDTYFPGMSPSDLAEVDGIHYTFSGANSWDVTIGALGTTESAIPEPATLTLLGLSLVALARRRKR